MTSRPLETGRGTQESRTTGPLLYFVQSWEDGQTSQVGISVDEVHYGRPLPFLLPSSYFSPFSSRDGSGRSFGPLRERSRFLRSLDLPTGGGE